MKTTSLKDHGGNVAVWAVTPAGAALAEKVAASLGNARVFVPASLDTPPANALFFNKLARGVTRGWAAYSAHVFIMASGIAVRVIAPHVASKLSDPAVVVADDAGRFCISLLSGHVGGANELTDRVAKILGATPVVTTATDAHGVPAVDAIAANLGLDMENPGAAKAVSMALLGGRKVWRYDPYGVLDDSMAEWTQGVDEGVPESGPGIWVHHEVRNLPEDVLVLRPHSLAVGMGCNSGTEATELKEVLLSVLEKNGLSLKSVRLVATIDDKVYEPGLDEMARDIARPLEGFARELLEKVTDVPNPSPMVLRHMGVNSVCEAAAILAANRGPLLVPKQKSGNVTVAVAAMPCTSSESAPEDQHTCHCGHGK
ncbi:MAG: cobalt-precorrin 5A hydrolase [Desulfatibacillaceae bacterium]